jgi:diacylglycerol kinase family enzyme
VLIINPYSSGMTQARERTIVRELREHMELDVRRTERPGHATRMAAELTDPARHDVVISCGGDGTANEILNGMSLGNGTAALRPKFAIIPAGGTNVLARSVGHPNHPVKALKQLIEGILHSRTRTINLGTVDERTYMFSAGAGLDGEVVKRVEARRSGRRPSDFMHLTQIVGLYASNRFALTDKMEIRVRGQHHADDLRRAHGPARAAGCVARGRPRLLRPAARVGGLRGAQHGAGPGLRSTQAIARDRRRGAAAPRRRGAHRDV